MGLLCSSVGKESASSGGDPGSTPGLGRSPGEENGNPLQYPCLEKLMDRGAWWAAVHGGCKELGMTEWPTFTYYPSILMSLSVNSHGTCHSIYIYLFPCKSEYIQVSLRTEIPDFPKKNVYIRRLLFFFPFFFPPIYCFKPFPVSLFFAFLNITYFVLCYGTLITCGATLHMIAHIINNSKLLCGKSSRSDRLKL